MSDDEWIKLGATIAASVTALKGIAEFSKSNKIKRVDLLNALINEFNSVSLDLAKRLLDDFEIIDIESPIIFYKDNFDIILRDHKKEPIGDDKTLIAVRESFDHLFEFFNKLEYLLSLDLISKNEFFYFLYYLYKIFNNKDILNFCRVYEYNSIFRLKYIFGYEVADYIVWRSKIYRVKAWVLRNMI